MNKVLNIASKVCFCLLLLWSARCLWEGLTIIGYTTGSVTGSEFGMLITLVNLTGFVLVWLSLFGAALGLRLLARRPAGAAPVANQ